MSKVTLTHDASFVYDMLAIASIKSARNPTNIAALRHVALLIGELQSQLGDEKHFSIIGSKEYRDLYAVNDEMYVRIDELKIRGEQPGDAKYIDDRVYLRWQAKKNLQEKWFGESVEEQKFGYVSQ